MLILVALYLMEEKMFKEPKFISLCREKKDLTKIFFIIITKVQIEKNFII